MICWLCATLAFDTNTIRNVAASSALTRSLRVAIVDGNPATKEKYNKKSDAVPDSRVSAITPATVRFLKGNSYLTYRRMLPCLTGLKLDLWRQNILNVPLSRIFKLSWRPCRFHNTDVGAWENIQRSRHAPFDAMQVRASLHNFSFFLFSLKQLPVSIRGGDINCFGRIASNFPLNIMFGAGLGLFWLGIYEVSSCRCRRRFSWVRCHFRPLTRFFHYDLKLILPMTGGSFEICEWGR